MTSSPIFTATATDVPALVTLVNSAYRGESSKRGWTTEADLLDGQRTDPGSILDILQKPGSVILKHVDESGKINGCVNLELQSTKLYLGMLTVDPELQGAGIGKKLLNAAEDYGRAKNANIIRMTVISVRDELIAWYRRHGYELTGETVPFPMGDPRFGLPRQELKFVVMEKSIAP
jgi:ribosomal protein S18 acetylase RimI-like enzyme